jgi:hypothetical protein
VSLDIKQNLKNEKKRIRQSIPNIPRLFRKKEIAYNSAILDIEGEILK